MEKDQPLDVTIELSGTIRLVRVAGRLDTTTAEAFDARLLDVAGAEGAGVVLDLAQVSYVSSAGLRSLLVLLKQVKAHGGVLVLAAVHPRVQDIFEIAGFTTMFPAAPTTDAALAMLQPNR
jgi:anti-sigma B factor antagonist